MCMCRRSAVVNACSRVYDDRSHFSMRVEWRTTTEVMMSRNKHLGVTDNVPIFVF